MIGRSSAAALLSVVLAGCGGTEVKGIIRDEDSGEPLPGAIVRMGDESTRTGPGGFYELEVDVDDDEPAQVMVGAPGYEPKAMLVTIDDDNDIVYSDIELKKEFSEQEYRRRQQELQMHQMELERLQQQERKQQTELERQQTQQDLDQVEQRVEEAERKVEEAEQRLEETTEPQPSEPGQLEGTQEQGSLPEEQPLDEPEGE